MESSRPEIKKLRGKCITLVNPCRTVFSRIDIPSVSLPLGLLSLAGVLTKHGHRVSIIDMMIKDFVIEKQGQHTQYGMPFEKLREYIKKSDASIFGVTIPFTVQLKNSFKALEIIKEEKPDALTVVGGNHCTHAGNQVLRDCNAADIVVMGEGEDTLLDIVSRYNEPAKKVEDIGGIKGIIYRDGSGNIQRNEDREFIDDPDEIPFPAYDLVNMEDYVDTKRNRFLYVGRNRSLKREVNIITSRGCPYKCSFCSIHLSMGRKYRQHSAQYVIKHLDTLISRYKVNHFHFEDDNFTLNRKRYTEILDHIINNKLKITWDTPNGVRADMWDYDLLVKTKKAGCVELAFGVESGNQHVLDNIIRKKLDLKTVEHSAGLCKQAGIDLKAFFIVGLPGETRQTMKETLDFAIQLMKKYNVTPLFSRLLPMFGTDIHVDAVKKGYIRRELTPETMATGNQETGVSLIETEDFKTEDVTSILKEMRKRTLFHQFKRLVTHPKLFWIKTYEQGPQTVKRYCDIFLNKKY